MEMSPLDRVKILHINADEKSALKIIDLLEAHCSNCMEQE
jgi:hypothetical protein